MSSIAERTKKAQQEEFDANPEHAALAEPTYALYEAVEGLSPQLRSLLVENTLRRVMQGVQELAMTEDPASRVVLGQGLCVFAGVAGYATALTREEEGETSTGDSRVDDIVDLCRDLIRSTISSQVPDDVKAEVDDMMKRIKVRIDNGEDGDEAFDAEYAVSKSKFGDHVVDDEGKVSKGKPKDDRPVPGLYL